MDINDNVALVTGGASGLGYASAAALIASGARVVIADLPSSGGNDAVRKLGDSARFAAVDVTDSEDVTQALDVASTWGDLRVVVNCAGVGNAIRTVSAHGSFPLEDFQRVIDINLVGTFNVTRLAAARMIELSPAGAERGVIVNTASVAAFDGQIGQAAYAASKAGVAGMTLPIARDLARSKIRVVTIAPGLFRTPLLGTLPESTIDSLERQVPHPSRLGRPEEFGMLVHDIVRNPMLNGETIRLDGAIRMSSQ